MSTPRNPVVPAWLSRIRVRKARLAAIMREFERQRATETHVEYPVFPRSFFTTTKGKNYK
jgi:hypothetical protein